MKIFVVVAGWDYECSEAVAVFSTEEKARQFTKKCTRPGSTKMKYIVNGVPYDTIEVTELELDKESV